MTLPAVADRIAQDVKYGYRALRRSPGLSIVAIVLLSLGIGLNAAVVSVLDRLFLRPPPGVSDATSVSRIHQHFVLAMNHDSRARDRFSYVELRVMAQSISSASMVAGYASTRIPVAGAQGVRDAGVTYVVEDYFRVLGLRPTIGRFFNADEFGRRGPTPLVVLSDRAWEREFSRSAAALGQSVVVGAQRMTIIGVAPRAFRGLGLDDTDYWMPFNATVTDSTAGRPFDMPMDVRFQVLLRAAAPRRRAAVGAAVARALQGTNPMISAGSTVTLAPVTDALDPQNDKMTVSVVWRLAIASLIVFVIACSNVANLMLIRMSRRRREIAIRFALGVSRGRLALHLLTEAILLALAAGIPAALTAGWGYLGLTNALLPRVAWDIGDEAVRGAGVVLVLMCMGGLAIGLLPALYLRDPDLADGLRSNIDSAPRASRFRAVLLVAQTALSVVLLAGAGLFVRSLAAVEQVGFGYRAENVLLASVAYDAKWSPLTRDESARVNETAQRIRALPGIANVALAWPMPLKGVGTSRLRLPGRDSVPTIPGVQTWMSVVSPGFFNVMGVRVVRGREFTDDDRRGGTPVALVSAAMASLYWPGEEPIGKCILVGYRSPVCRIVVGVVADVHAFKIFETQSLHYYVPYAQESRELAMPRTLVVGIDSTAGPAVSTRLRRALGGDVGGGLRWEVTTLANVMEPEFRPWRLSATLVAVLGLIAIVVAGIGTYGTTAFAVSQRVHELSVRRILGATGRHIAALVMIGTLRLVAIGALIGMTVVLAAGPLAKSMLYGVSGHDPHSLGLAVLLQIIGGAAACVVPTLYAVRTEPTVALASSG